MDEYEKYFNTRQFIEEIKERRPLWDHNVVVDKYLRRKLWDEITDAMCEDDKSEEFKKKLNKILQSKWRNLKWSFKRYHSIQTDKHEPKKKQYLHYEQLQFLLCSREYKAQWQGISRVSPTKQLETINKLKSLEQLEEWKRPIDKDEKFILSLIDDFKSIPDDIKPILRTQIEVLIKTALIMKKSREQESQKTMHKELISKETVPGLSAPDFVPSGNMKCEQDSTPAIGDSDLGCDEYISPANVTCPYSKVILNDVFIQTPEWQDNFDPNNLFTVQEKEILPNSF